MVNPTMLAFECLLLYCDKLFNDLSAAFTLAGEKSLCVTAVDTATGVHAITLLTLNPCVCKYLGCHHRRSRCFSVIFSDD